MTTERYRLIFVHEYLDNDGEAHRIEEPIYTDYNIIRDERTPPAPIIINEMIEKLKSFLLNSVR